MALRNQHDGVQWRGALVRLACPPQRAQQEARSVLLGAKPCSESVVRAIALIAVVLMFASTRFCCKIGRAGMNFRVRTRWLTKCADIDVTSDDALRCARADFVFVFVCSNRDRNCSHLRGGAAILRRVLLLSLNDCKLAGDIVRWSSVERMVVGMIASAMQQPVRRVTAR